MASTAVYDRATRRIAQLSRSPSDARTFRLDVLDALAALDFSAYAWLLTDPVTTVGCAPLADVPCLPELPRLIRLKYLTATNRWTTIGNQAISRLDVATGGDLSRSMLWRELLGQYGVIDVASLVFEDRFGCWGFMDLWRTGASPPFSNDDASFLASICPPVAAALRRCQALNFLVPPSGHQTSVGPVVMLLSPALDVLAQTPETEQFLRILVPPEPHVSPIPASAYNVAAQLLAVESAVDNHDPRARAYLADGVWVTVSAARMGDSGPIDRRNIAISIESTTATDRLMLFGLAFGLSSRERQILAVLATGVDTRELARRAFVSEHTVQDHLKSIFAKTGSNTRRKLLSLALGS